MEKKVKNMFDGKRILVTGGTGSLGKVLIKRLLSGVHGLPEKIIIFSRDEAKQHELRLESMNLNVSTEEIIYHSPNEILDFRIGDVRDYDNVVSVLQNVDIVFNAAALKQVPTCEYFPEQAVMTNVIGAENIVKAILNHNLSVETVIGISTDKAVSPVNVMGMTKALQERIIINGNISCPATKFICVRYGNVLASRGSVIPLFHQQLLTGKDLTITDPRMTRFLISLEQAVDTIVHAYRDSYPGDIFIPIIPASSIIDVAKAIKEDADVDIKFIGIRPGEKLDEVLISEEEAFRTVKRGEYYIIKPILPELNYNPDEEIVREFEYRSNEDMMTFEETRVLLEENKLTWSYISQQDHNKELLR